jgi:hypothetical protein
MHGSSGRVPAQQHEALSENPNTVKKKNIPRKSPHINKGNNPSRCDDSGLEVWYK